ncbi:diguanylate cyclase [Ectopseudomonas mendocina]|jgi:diguanylate cyclase (GGDEF)-like protein|uniref:diguanylate cyclase n=1 Tax=Ectopseudomonas mendocina TaxID=300 RepID=UPI0015C9B52E
MLMLQLHLPTLLVASTAVISLCGVLLIFSWSQGRQQRALLWTGAMMLLAALGLVLNALRGGSFDWVPIVLGNIVLLLCIAMNWSVMRVFCGRAPSYPWVCAGAACWALLCLWPTFYNSLAARVAVHTLIASLYLLAALVELWRARLRLEVSVVPMAVLVSLHLMFLLARMFLGPGMTGYGDIQSNPLFTLVLIESMLYAVGIAFMLLSMVKERAEKQFRQAAYSDELTGVGNRRAFFEAGERLLSLCQRQRRPVALLSFDLDHFKAINDELGHQEGDRVLKAFASGVAQSLRRSDVFGRIGGEEFACLIDGNATDALALAERIRVGFSALAPKGREQSVSIGLVAVEWGTYDLQYLLNLADKALYQAKRDGRNRVEIYQSDAGGSVGGAEVG